MVTHVVSGPKHPVQEDQKRKSRSTTASLGQEVEAEVVEAAEAVADLESVSSPIAMAEAHQDGKAEAEVKETAVADLAVDNQAQGSHSAARANLRVEAQAIKEAKTTLVIVAGKSNPLELKKPRPNQWSGLFVW